MSKDTMAIEGKDGCHNPPITNSLLTLDVL